MNLERKNLIVIFLFSLLAVLLFPIMLPSWRLMLFAPFIVIIFYRKSYLVCLWWSLFCGLFIDLLSDHQQFGINALNYCLTTSLLYGQRRNFFADSPSTLPIMTFFFSSLSTFIQFLLMYIFEKENVFSWNWVLTDAFLMPFLDASFAFCCFIIPSVIFGKRPRKGKDYFLDKSGNM